MAQNSDFCVAEQFQENMKVFEANWNCILKKYNKPFNSGPEIDLKCMSVSKKSENLRRITPRLFGKAKLAVNIKSDFTCHNGDGVNTTQVPNFQGDPDKNLSIALSNFNDKYTIHYQSAGDRSINITALADIKADILGDDVSDAETLYSDDQLDSNDDTAEDDNWEDGTANSEEDDDHEQIRNKSYSSLSSSSGDSESDDSDANHRFLSLQQSPFTSPVTMSKPQHSAKRSMMTHNSPRSMTTDSGFVSHSLTEVQKVTSVGSPELKQHASDLIHSGYKTVSSSSKAMPPVRMTRRTPSKQCLSDKFTQESSHISDCSEHEMTESVSNSTENSDTNDYKRLSMPVIYCQNSTSVSSGEENKKPSSKTSKKLMYESTHVRKSKRSTSHRSRSVGNRMEKLDSRKMDPGTDEISSPSSDDSGEAEMNESSRPRNSDSDLDSDKISDTINLDDTTTWSLERLLAQSFLGPKLYVNNVKPMKKVQHSTLFEHKGETQRQTKTNTNTTSDRGSLHIFSATCEAPASPGSQVFQSQPSENRICQSVPPKVKKNLSAMQHRQNYQKKSCSVIPKIKQPSRNLCQYTDEELTRMLTSPLYKIIPGLPPLDIEKDIQLSCEKSQIPLQAPFAETVVCEKRNLGNLRTLEEPSALNSLSRKKTLSSSESVSKEAQHIGSRSTNTSTEPTTCVRKEYMEPSQSSLEAFKQLKMSTKDANKFPVKDGKSFVDKSIATSRESRTCVAAQDSKTVTPESNRMKVFRELKKSIENVPSYITLSEDKLYRKNNVRRWNSTIGVKPEKHKVSSDPVPLTPVSSKLAQAFEKLKMSTPQHTAHIVKPKMITPQSSCNAMLNMATTQPSLGVVNSKTSPYKTPVEDKCRQIKQSEIRKKLIMTSVDQTTNNSSQSAIDDSDSTSSGILGDVDSEESETLHGSSDFSLITLIADSSDGDISEEESVIHVLSSPRTEKKQSNNEQCQFKTTNNLNKSRKEIYVSPSVLFSSLKLQSPKTIDEKLSTSETTMTKWRGNPVFSSNSKSHFMHQGRSLEKNTPANHSVKDSSRTSTLHSVKHVCKETKSCTKTQSLVSASSSSKDYICKSPDLRTLPQNPVIKHPAKVCDNTERNPVSMTSPRNDIPANCFPAKCLKNVCGPKQGGAIIPSLCRMKKLSKQTVANPQKQPPVTQLEKTSSQQNLNISHSVETKQLCRTSATTSSKQTVKALGLQNKVQSWNFTLNQSVRGSAVAVKPSSPSEMSCPSTLHVLKSAREFNGHKPQVAVTSTPNKRGKMKSFEIGSISMIEAHVDKSSDKHQSKDDYPFSELTSSSQETPKRFFKTRDGAGSAVHLNVSSTVSNNLSKCEQPCIKNAQTASCHMFGFSELLSPNNSCRDSRHTKDLSNSDISLPAFSMDNNVDVYEFSESENDFPYTFEEWANSGISKVSTKQRDFNKLGRIQGTRNKERRQHKSWFAKSRLQFGDERKQTAKRKRDPSDEDDNEHSAKSDCFRSHSKTEQARKKIYRDRTFENNLSTSIVSTSLSISFAANTSSLCPGAELCTKSFCFSCIKD